MKILLAAINAKYIHSNPAIYSLRACVKEEHRDSVFLAEYTINQYARDILADLYRQRPDVIGFSVYIWNRTIVEELLCELPKVLPGVEIWLGGPEVSYGCKELLTSFPGVKGVIIGEGENTFREIVCHYLEGEEAYPLCSIPGLYLRSGYTPVREATDLSTLPFLYDDLAPFTNRIIYYETSRGCPYRCSYCLSSLEKQVRFRNMELVKKELRFFLEKKVAQVKFIDRTFNCHHEHACEIWQFLKENDNGVTNFHFEISADILREEEIALLGTFRPGLAQLEIGVQTANPDTLAAIHRVSDLGRLEQIVGALRKGNNIHLHLDLIAGLPYEDFESFGRSFDRVYGMKPHQLQLGFLKVLKGSEMEEKAEEFHIVYQDKPPYEVLYTRWLSYEDVLKLKGIEEMVELYYNSGQFTHTLPVLEQAFPSPFAMYRALEEYYRAEGYFTNSPSRGYRYEILLKFARQVDGAGEALYRELLTFDYYLRENAKSRPDFAPDREEYREDIRSFYRSEEETRAYLPFYQEYDWKQLSKMTHLEPFTYPVWEEGVSDAAEGRPAGFVLFDYRCRNPLSGAAAISVISAADIKKEN
ncbi:MAG: B12-binding domain-containing radical SAM protein [Acetatifactor sp.]